MSCSVQTVWRLMTQQFQVLRKLAVDDAAVSDVAQAVECNEVYELFVWWKSLPGQAQHSCGTQFCMHAL